MTYYYVNPDEREHCFDCPLPDCFGHGHPACPIFEVRAEREARGLELDSQGREVSKDRAATVETESEPPAGVPDGYLTVDEVAVRLRIPRNTIYAWLSRGRINTDGCRKIGSRRQWIIPERRLGDFARLRRRNGDRSAGV